jgi:hypothetical protein
MYVGARPLNGNVRGLVVTIAGAHFDRFFGEVRQARSVWTIRDSGGYPAPQGDGGRSMPFWSSRRRAELIIAKVHAYAGFEPVELDLETFMDRWLPGLATDKLRVGINWSGAKAMGYDVDPTEVLERLLGAGAQASNKSLERSRDR